MSRNRPASPEPDDDALDSDELALPEVETTLEESGDWTVSVTFPSGWSYEATAETEAGAGMLVGIGLALAAGEDDAEEDVRAFVELLGCAIEDVEGGEVGEN